MSDGLEYLGCARLQGLVLLLLAFLVGLLAGAAGDRVLTRSRAPEPRPREQRDDREGRPRMPRELEQMDLTAAQHAAIDSIIASGRPRNEAVMNLVVPRLRAISDSLQRRHPCRAHAETGSGVRRLLEDTPGARDGVAGTGAGRGRGAPARAPRAARRQARVRGRAPGRSPPRRSSAARPPATSAARRKPAATAPRR